MPGYVVHNETTVAEQGGQSTHIHQEYLPKRPYRFIGRSTSYEPQAILLEAQEAIVQLRHVSPRVNCRLFCYYPSRDGYGRLPQVANGDREMDPALLHLVRYIRAQEALYEQVTLDLIPPHGDLGCLTPRRRDAEPDATNPIVLFGRPIEPLRSTPLADSSHAPISLEELHHILGIFSNGTVGTSPYNANHCYPAL
ncbi:hypothetical protein D1007_43345 [Hordeum vulgare]|nr:hypothetical protein D1007_43345 [Hordeum vulgare]